LSPGGKRLARQIYDFKDKKWCVIIDGQAGPWYDSARTPIFSADSKHFAYCAKQDQKHLLVIDGKVKSEYDDLEIDTSTLEFSPGERLFCVAKKGLKRCVVVDGQVGPEYDSLLPDKPFFSPDGKRFAYTAHRGQKRVVVVDGESGPEYDDIGMGPPLLAPGRPAVMGYRSPIFSPDSKHVAYIARKDQKWFVVVDG